jgi:hypothetical protein
LLLFIETNVFASWATLTTPLALTLQKFAKHPDKAHPLDVNDSHLVLRKELQDSVIHQVGSGIS